MSKLLTETLEELAAAAITGELADRFGDLDPLAIVNTQQAAITAKSQELGLQRLTPEDRQAVADLIDSAVATITVGFR